MQTSITIAPRALALLRAKTSDLLILDWLILQSEASCLKRIDIEKILGIPRSCVKHKILGLKKAGLITSLEKQSTSMLYKIMSIEELEANTK